MTDQTPPNGALAMKAMPEADVLRRTVQAVPASSANLEPAGSLTMQLATVADDILPWGRNPWRRDKQLREFWPTENLLASTIYATAIRNSAFSWKLDGPPRTVAAVQDMLHAADLGKGWLHFMIRVTIDLLTQDNAAFIELVRAGASETSPVIGIAHLDAERCRRTGDPRVPVIYRDRLGGLHKLAWHQVITLEEMPSPIETMNGMQYCFVTRVLRAAQILRDIAIYKREKIGARGPSSIHLVGGVSQSRIDDSQKKADEKGDNQGFIRYLLPTILAGLDPSASVSHVEIPIKSLPDDFDEDVTMRWYISELALGSGNDYQDLAPLPGGGIGSSNQSEILHRKSRGKGPGLFMKLVEHAFTFHGVIPQSVKFHYDEQDTAADKEKADLAKTRADVFAVYTGALQMPYQVVWQMMADQGDITQAQLDMLGQQDVTDDVTATDDQDYEEPEDIKPIPGTEQPPAGALPSATVPSLVPAAKGGDIFDGLRQWVGGLVGRARQDALESETTQALRESVRALKEAQNTPDIHQHHIDVHVPEQKALGSELAEMSARLSDLVTELRAAKEREMVVQVSTPEVHVPTPQVTVQVQMPEGVEEHEVTARDGEGRVKRWVKRWTRKV